jgi:hypothetical protein
LKRCDERAQWTDAVVPTYVAGGRVRVGADAIRLKQCDERARGTDTTVPMYVAGGECERLLQPQRPEVSPSDEISPALRV